jgi:hypothetical protein
MTNARGRGHRVNNGQQRRNGRLAVLPLNDLSGGIDHGNVAR